MNVLIADDESANLKLLRLLLEHAGHKVLCAKDGLEALETLEREKIDAVISDILMPRMDGYRLCLEIRKHKALADLPFMFYTSTYTSAGDEETARKMGADRFLRKPAGAAEILAALKQSVEDKEPSRRKPRLPSEELGLMREYSARLVSKLEQRNLELERAEQEARKSQEQLRALAARLQAAREDERIRISREMHDELGELLTGFKLGLAWIRDALKELPQADLRPELLEKIAGLGALADSTSVRVRKLCSELRPAVLDDLGLVAAIEWQAREFQKRTNIRCELNLAEKYIVANSDQATALFRILQEILTNVARHSHASKVRVVLKAEDEHLVLEAKDNGKGITTEERSGTGSLGLLGMQERAAVLGGRVEIQGQKGKGTSITVTIPMGRPFAAPIAS